MNRAKIVAWIVTGSIAIAIVCTFFYAPNFDRNEISQTSDENLTRELYWIEEEFERIKVHLVVVKNFMMAQGEESLVAYRQSVAHAEMLGAGLNVFIPIDDTNALESFQFLFEHDYFTITKRGDEVVFEHWCISRHFRYGIAYLVGGSLLDNYYQDSNSYTLTVEASKETGWYFFADDISSLFDDTEESED